MLDFRYGELVNINMVRDKATGKTKGFCFICYEDQRSTDLAVDNFNGIKVTFQWKIKSFLPILVLWIGLSLRIFRHSYCGRVVQKSHSSTPKFTRPHIERTKYTNASEVKP